MQGAEERSALELEPQRQGGTEEHRGYFAQRKGEKEGLIWLFGNVEIW